MINLQSVVNTNGHAYQLIIDNNKRTVLSGYNLFISWDVKRLPITQLKDIKTAFINDGYKDLNGGD